MERIGTVSKANFIIFDFEVYPNDTLFGAILIANDGLKCFQTWDRSRIIDFYRMNAGSFWIGHNNQSYGNIILQSIVYGEKNTYSLSERIISGADRTKLGISLHYIDLMKIYDKDSSYSLEMVKGASGKKISNGKIINGVGNILSNSEKEYVESSNLENLNQIYQDFLFLKDKIEIRIDLCKEFGLQISHVMDTESMLGSMVLGARKVNGISKMEVKPIWYENISLENTPIRIFGDDESKSRLSTLKDFYISNQFRNNLHFEIDLCGNTIIGGSGGLHSAAPRYYCKDALYFDVSGYYNLIMINLGLLPRSLDELGKKRYIHCYEEQLRLKNVNPKKRTVYKTILLTVFGGMLNQYTDFYDPWNGNLVMIVGQIYIIDLLQKLEGKIQLIQTNTDGIIVKPLDWNGRDEIISMVEEWEKRTGFVIKKTPIHNIWQRDVNCYSYESDNGDIHVVGENGIYDSWKNPFDRGAWKLKEPPIIAHCIIDYFHHGILPEDTVKKYEDNLRMFQYIIKKDSFDYLTYEVKDKYGNYLSWDKIQDIDRVFPLRYGESEGMIYKVKKNARGCEKKQKISCLSNVFIYNDDINDEHGISSVKKKIDFSYYIIRAYEKIKKFLPD